MRLSFDQQRSSGLLLKHGHLGSTRTLGMNYTNTSYKDGAVRYAGDHQTFASKTP